MAPLKRKRDVLEDSDDDEPLLGRQILPVADLPDSFDEVPVDGMQYLFTVRRDARHLPHITRAANPYERVEQPETSLRRDPSHPSLPSEEWVKLVEMRFKNLRQNLNQPTIHVDFAALNKNRKIMPEKDERDLWWAYLAGKPEMEWNLSKKTKRLKQTLKRTQEARGMRAWADEHNQDVPYGETTQPWHATSEGQVKLDPKCSPSDSPVQSAVAEDNPSNKSSVIFDISSTGTFCVPREPSPVVIQGINERMALHILMYFIHWINLHVHNPNPPLTNLTESHARWIFFLLSRIDDKISSENISLLRDLARACFLLLKIVIQEQTMPTPFGGQCASHNFAASMVSERSCWMIISIIVGIWKQKDLWMEAEDVLFSLGH